MEVLLSYLFDPDTLKGPCREDWLKVYDKEVGGGPGVMCTSHTVGSVCHTLGCHPMPPGQVSQALPGP